VEALKGIGRITHLPQSLSTSAGKVEIWCLQLAAVDLQLFDVGNLAGLRPFSCAVTKAAPPLGRAASKKIYPLSSPYHEIIPRHQIFVTIFCEVQ
jgi:hypothetical protein